MNPFRLFIAAATLTIAPIVCLAQVDEGAKEILAQSAAAIKNANGLEMTTAKSATGLLKDVIDASGKVRLLRMKDSREAMYEIDGRVKQPTKGDDKVRIVSDGSTVTWIDESKKELIERPESDTMARNTVNLVHGMLLHRVFLDVEPFSREMSSARIERLGVENVGGEVCDLVSVAPAKGQMKEIWAISAIDRLPRRLVQAAGEGAQSVSMVFEVKTVKPMPLTRKDFSLELPEGYSRNLAPAPPVQAAANTPAVPVEVVKLGMTEGEPLPSFSLIDSAGKTFGNSSLTQGATVIYFFGSLFKPSTDGLDDLQVLQEQYKDRGVDFVAVACREPSAQTAQDLLSRRQMQMRLVPAGDAAMSDLKVVGFPSCYVLGPGGKVVSFFQGPATKQQLAQAIDQALAGK